MLGITWREKLLGLGSAEVNQSLGLLDFFLWGYVKNTVYQVKINSIPESPHKGRCG
jgi:hypothetical protein